MVRVRVRVRVRVKVRFRNEVRVSGNTFKHVFGPTAIWTSVLDPNY